MLTAIQVQTPIQPGAHNSKCLRQVAGDMSFFLKSIGSSLRVWTLILTASSRTMTQIEKTTYGETYVVQDDGSKVEESAFLSLCLLGRWANKQSQRLDLHLLLLFPHDCGRCSGRESSTEGRPRGCLQRCEA